MLKFLKEAITGTNKEVSHIEQGNTLSKAGQKQEAIAEYDKAISIDPNSAEAYFNKGDALSALGDKQGAIECYNKAIEINPNEADAYNNKGLALLALGENQEAIECFNKALEINPNYAAAYNNRGNALLALGCNQAAIECYNKALVINPNLADAYYGKGNALLALGCYRAAIECYHKALVINPNLADAYYGKGYALSALGYPKEAIECYNKALELNPNYAHAYNGKGSALFSLGENQGAIECHNKAIVLSPNYAHFYGAKGNALSALGDKQGAIECFNKAQAIKQAAEKSLESKKPTGAEQAMAGQIAKQASAQASSGSEKPLPMEGLKTGKQASEGQPKADQLKGGTSTETKTERLEYGLDQVDQITEALGKKVDLNQSATETQKTAMKTEIVGLGQALKDIKGKVAANDPILQKILTELNDLIRDKDITYALVDDINERLDKLKNQKSMGNDGVEACYYVKEIIYDNELLNHPKLFNKLANIYGANKVLDLSSQMSPELLHQAIESDLLGSILGLD